MKNGRSKVADLRREQIVDAAVAVITEQGIQNLSLSEIEKKIGMSRGQLTYYFNTKEAIFLAIFDRLLALMCQQHNKQPAFAEMDWLQMVRSVLTMILQDPPAHPEFHALHHTFLSQISHREDFRQHLGSLYEQWRCQGAEDLARQLNKRRPVRKLSPRALATVVQAIFHGLAVQKAVDPQAIDAKEIVHLCLDMLGTYLWVAAGPRPTRKRRAAKPRSARYRTPLIGEGIAS